MKNICVIKEPTTLYFPTITGESCYLKFGYGAMFNYEVQSRKVKLSRRNMDFYISKIEFDKLFKTSL